MFKPIFTALAGAILLLGGMASFPPESARAHELLPSEIVELMKENPDLTEADIEEYVRKRDGTTSQNVAHSSAFETLLIGRNEDATLPVLIWNFLVLGVQHILEGIDHVLFVLSLLLVFVSVRHIGKLVTAFTIAHSITFILAGFGLIVLSPRVVEPLIALSIAYMAISTVFFSGHKWLGGTKNKVSGVFFFGLFHGLGFAGLLGDFAIPKDNFLPSLISFNVGIEIGQFIILALAVPYILLLKNKAWYPAFVKVSAVLISQIACIWMIERIADFKVLPF